MIKEPKHACPLIDKAIENFKYSEKEILNNCEALLKHQASSESTFNLMQNSASDTQSWFADINFIETLEELRSRCSDLREWGKQWQAKAEKLEEELDKLKEKLND
jgi:hypothetical protein